MTYKTIIGLEIHAELSTDTKIFCSCINAFGGDVNTHVCPVCLGLPGAMPILNKAVVEYGIKAGMAFQSKIAPRIKMDKKNYFYSDLTKGYQISQDDMPLCEGGYIEIPSENGMKKVHLIRIHIEEDTGKSVHNETGDTLLDYNRAGVPLIEIVSSPEMNSAEEARLFLDKLRATLKYIGVSDVKMEEGSLRCDVNINVVDEQSGKKTNITEVKNISSFRGVVRAIESEEARHIALLEKGENTSKETRRWAEVINEAVLMREKGGVGNYRFNLEADIPPTEIPVGWVEEIKANLPELPGHKKSRFISEYGISEYDAEVLTQTRELADFYEDTVRYNGDSKLVSNWIMGDVLRRLNEEELEIEQLKFSAKSLSELLNLVKNSKINNNTGKKVLREMFDTGKEPEEIVKDGGLIQISDESELIGLIEKTLDDNPQSIEDFKNGKDRAIGFLVGQIMKASKGKANPQIVNRILSESIKQR